jgi:Flp pilus assembly secretin CpaC
MSLKKAWVALALAAMVAPAAAADPFKLKIDETVTLKLTSPANSVVIGNATVADVAVHDPLTLLITGKAFGSTNLIVLDRAGRTIYTNQLAVADSANDDITIAAATPALAPAGARADAVSALVNLGYQPGDAARAVAQAARDIGEDAKEAQLIRAALKALAPAQ